MSLLLIVTFCIWPSEFTHDARTGRRLEDPESAYWDDALIDTPYSKAHNKYWIFVHIIVIGYMLLGLNTVCDVYFTGALDEMVNKWKIKPDVAGATFMAAGGSAPELFTSLIGAVISESDVGFGTIVGSAVFNVLFVIGLCGFAAAEPINLSWWPLFRDCSFYVLWLSVLAVFALTGGEIQLWEAIVLFLGYIWYCTLMYFNPNLEERFVKVVGEQTPTAASSQIDKLSQVAPVPDTGSTGGTPNPTEESSPSERGASHESDARHHIKKSQPQFARQSTIARTLEAPERSGNVADIPPPVSEESPNPPPDEDEEDPVLALVLMPDGTVAQIMWMLSLPVYGPLYLLTPTPSEETFLRTFFMSLFWIAGFSFFLVYCVEILGAVLKIHIIVMGFTLLAAGTSIPDAVSSVAVARAGEGDMAISSSIGSNIFDILVGLPIPWIIKIAIVEMAMAGNSTFTIVIHSDYIAIYVIILIFMVAMVVLSIHSLGWVLNRTLGVGMAVLYAFFLATVLAVEFGQPTWLKMR